MTKQALILLAAALCSTVASAEDLELDTPHVTVFGTAEIKVTPNEMIWSVNVNTKNESLQVTAKQHTETVQKVLSFLKGLKIDENKLQTSRMQFRENWKTIDRERVKAGYYASTDVSFTISDFGLYQKIWF
ncbi:MAG: SIMPL domain-containing protein, partial [Planctomycetota bacterium]